MSELEKTMEWFKQAIPEPTTEQACVQIGCAYEETAELAKTLCDISTNCELVVISDYYKSAEIGYVNGISQLDRDEKIQMLDDIIDEIVTRVGIGHCMGFDIQGALKEVNRSNFSKFEDGKPVFDKNGKITKGKNYSKPDLSPFI